MARSKNRFAALASPSKKHVQAEHINEPAETRSALQSDRRPRRPTYSEAVTSSQGTGLLDSPASFPTLMASSKETFQLVESSKNRRGRNKPSARSNRGCARGSRADYQGNTGLSHRGQSRSAGLLNVAPQSDRLESRWSQTNAEVVQGHQST